MKSLTVVSSLVALVAIVIGTGKTSFAADSALKACYQECSATFDVPGPGLKQCVAACTGKSTINDASNLVLDCASRNGTTVTARVQDNETIRNYVVRANGKLVSFGSVASADRSDRSNKYPGYNRFNLVNKGDARAVVLRLPNNVTSQNGFYALIQVSDAATASTSTLSCSLK